MRFGFGPATTPFYPLVGDWDQDGLDTIGIVDPVNERYFLENSLAGGTADASGTGGLASLGAKDGPWVWDGQDPALTHFLRWEAMPTNRDLPYDCSGRALTAYQPTETTCPEKFLTELVLWKYDAAAKVWRSSRIDRAWGGSYPLTYWRSRGLVASSFARQPMVGTQETRTTYPRFYRGPQGDFLFKYRQGASGDGEWIINRYDVRTYRWSRLLAQPLFGR